MTVRRLCDGGKPGCKGTLQEWEDRCIVCGPRPGLAREVSMIRAATLILAREEWQTIAEALIELAIQTPEQEQREHAQALITKLRSVLPREWWQP